MENKKHLLLKKKVRGNIYLAIFVKRQPSHHRRHFFRAHKSRTGVSASVRQCLLD
jgi:hypothetical protein